MLPIRLLILACVAIVSSSLCVPAVASTGYSFLESRDSFYKASPDILPYDRSWIKPLDNGEDGPTSYNSMRQAGTEAKQEFTIPGNAPAHNAAKNESTDTPHPFMQQRFTEYSYHPWNEFGGPTKPGPFRITEAYNNPMRGMTPGFFKNAPWLNGASPASDAVFQSISLTAASRMAETLNEPDFTMDQAAFQGKMQQSERSAGAAAGDNFKSTVATVQQSLINVANENAATPVAKGSDIRTLPQAVWMVQQLYKAVFIPMAVLLVPPGAVITQFRGVIGLNFGGTPKDGDRDHVSPFSGIMRATIAIFLIPATQLIISYSIDIGNALTSAVQGQIDSAVLLDWGNRQTTPPLPANYTAREREVQAETTSDAMTNNVFNQIDMFLNYGLTVLIAYQIIMMCYLLLMGPISAALYAWPGNMSRLFKLAITNWIDAVTILALWRFWWCTILLCMSTRIHWLQEVGQYDPMDPWEKGVYTAFLVMLAYVPFAPFDFRPGDLVDSLSSKAGAQTSD